MWERGSGGLCCYSKKNNILKERRKYVLTLTMNNAFKRQVLNPTRLSSKAGQHLPQPVFKDASCILPFWKPMQSSVRTWGLHMPRYQMQWRTKDEYTAKTFRNWLSQSEWRREMLYRKTYALSLLNLLTMCGAAQEKQAKSRMNSSSRLSGISSNFPRSCASDSQCSLISWSSTDWWVISTPAESKIKEPSEASSWRRVGIVLSNDPGCDNKETTSMH